MKVRKTKQGLTVQAVAGMHVVLLGMNLKRADCDGLLGFAIHRTDHTEGEAYWLKATKTFAETDPGLPPGSSYPTTEHPIQGFTWSDFSAKPGHRYTYRVQALRGTPRQLEAYKEVAVRVRTESEEGGDHDVYFNRGAAASQEYARRFGSRAPDEANPRDPRWAWLSRGAMEAILAFVGRAADRRWGLRVAAYEFRLDAFAEALAQARRRGAGVKILYDGGTAFPRDDNRKTARAARLEPVCIERITRAGVKRPPISHHKFVVLLKNGKPVAVLTGSTNFSLGGVYGQANLVHIVEDPKVAARYLRCWELMKDNPEYRGLRTQLAALGPVPADKPPKGTSTLFSPRPTLDALQWYAARARAAQDALFMTFAFGINKVFLDAYAKGRARLRYALLDKLLGPGVKKDKRPAAEAEMKRLRFMTANRFAVGSRIAVNKFDRWVRESLTGLNQHVQYIHTKFMLVDPLGDDPLVITGSANFSDASTTSNDENMLVIRGNRRVAEIYLGEYMRLWNHYAFREWAGKQKAPAQAGFQHLDVKNRWWKQYFGDTDRSRQREYFAGA